MRIEKKDSLVSVIVPIYNIENYIGKCIESIVNQTYKNIEILLVDDGSLDDSYMVCESYAAKDNRIRIIRKQNGGLSDARNKGIDCASGQYIVFIDGDDYIKEDYIEKLFDTVKSNGADIAICSFCLVDDNGQILNTAQLEELPSITDGYSVLSAVMTDYGYKYVVAWNKIYKRCIFSNIRFDKGKIFEDEYINFKMFWACEKVAICDQPLYCYVQRNGSITQSKMSLKKIDMKTEMHKTRIAFYKDKDKLLYYKACQMYCDWLVECTRSYYDVIASREEPRISIMQKEIRHHMMAAMCSKNTTFPRKIQNVLGVISLKFAANIKNIYKKS